MPDNLFISILNISCLLWTIVSLTGYILYKYRTGVASWEDGIKRVVTLGLDWIHEEATGQAASAKIINPSLLLTNNEALQLTQSFDRHPYDTPVLVSYVPNVNGISWYDIQAVGLIQKYASLTHAGIRQIAEHIIQTYYMNTRNTQIILYIRIATPTRLYFAVPLSAQGNAFLANNPVQQNPNTLSSCNSIPTNPVTPVSGDSLEETVETVED